MARIARHSIVATHELVAEISADFAGGPIPDDPFDSGRLREACNLMARLCSRLSLTGDYAITPMRDVTQMVSLAFACARDYELVAHLAQGDVPKPVGNNFVLNETTHLRLIEVAGSPDHSGPGRRTKYKEEESAQAFNPRWTSSGGGSPNFD